MAKENDLPKVRTLRIRINPMWLITLLIVGGFIAVGLFSRGEEDKLGSQITVSQFIQNIKENKYSVAEIREDKKAIGYQKFILLEDDSLVDFERNIVDAVDKVDEQITVTGKKSTTITDSVSDLKEITLDELLDLIKPPTFTDVIAYIQGDRSKDIEAIIVGDNFLIAKRADRNGEDYIVKEVGEDRLESALLERGYSSEDIAVKVIQLKNAAKNSDTAEILSYYDKSAISDIWHLELGYRVNDTQVNQVALIATPNISREFVDTKFTEDFAKFLQDGGVSFDNDTVQITSVEVTKINWDSIINIVSFLGLGLLAFFLIRGIQGSGNRLSQFGESKAKMFFGRKPEVTFEDVAGIDEAKTELQEIVMFLKQPAKFLKMGARIPKGVLMVGSPGTGKTLLARAIAGEAGVPFFHTSGAEFEEMLVGAGASRVRDLFAKAKKASPALIFIDEIDALARKRGTTVQSSTTEQTLNQILVEMDGFEKNTEVIVIAATNRPDVLDPAILRPGRFDRRIVLDLPDIEGRHQILKIHSKNKPLAKSVDLHKAAKRTVGFSGADLENVLNEAAIIATQKDQTEINYSDIEEAATKVSLGPEKKRKRSDEELKMTAYHEAGHAIVAKYASKSDPVHRITIVSRGMSLGSTMQLPQEDKNQQTQTEMESRIMVLLGGRAAEEIVFKDITSGASNDIEKATSIARRMVKQFGMSKKLGLVKYGESNELQYLGYGYGEQRDYSEETAKEIDEAVKAIVATAYDEAKALLNKHRKKLDKLSKELLEKEVIEGDEFEKLMK